MRVAELWSRLLEGLAIFRYSGPSERDLHPALWRLWAQHAKQVLHDVPVNPGRAPA